MLPIRTLIIALPLLTLSRAADLRAQSTPSAEPGAPQVEVVKQRSPLVAGLLEGFVFPTIGYAYGGNWRRGIPSAVVRLAGACLMFGQWDESSELGAGQVLYAIGTAWAVIDAVGTTKRENESRRTEAARLAIVPALANSPPELRVGLHLPW